MKAKILFMDIETRPNVAYVWGLFKQNVGLNQIIERGEIISFGAKWLGEDEVMYYDDFDHTPKELMQIMYSLFDEADIIIGHNGDRFDIPWINRTAVINGLTPPSPSFTIDTLKVAKKAFRFVSNKLENLAIELGCTPKESHAKFAGFSLWTEYMAKNPEAREEMKVYCKQDVGTLEEIYLKLRPYIKNHPNVSLFEDLDGEKVRCSKCGSDRIHYRGYATTNVSMFRRYRCIDCGGWGRQRTNVIPKEKRVSVGTNIAAGI